MTNRWPDFMDMDALCRYFGAPAEQIEEMIQREAFVMRDGLVNRKHVEQFIEDIKNDPDYWSKHPQIQKTASRPRKATTEPKERTEKIVQGWIYFVESGDRIKIGYSSSLTRRMKNIKHGSPFPTELLLYIDGSMADEKALHKRFAKARLNGEWFAKSSELMKFIQRKVMERIVEQQKAKGNPHRYKSAEEKREESG